MVPHPAEDRGGDLRIIADHPGHVDGVRGGNIVKHPQPKSPAGRSPRVDSFCRDSRRWVRRRGKKLLRVQHAAEAGFRHSDGK